MAKKWNEVAVSAGFKALPPDQQDGARRQYFDEVVAPQVPSEHRDVAWDQFSADAGVGRRELPSGVKPSTAGGGRGAAPDPRRLDTPTEQPASEQSDPMGSGIGTSIMDVARPRRSSVLEGMQMPEPQFDSAEAVRLSNRRYAESQDPKNRQPIRREYEMREAPVIENRSALRAVGDTALGVTQGALGLVKGVADNVGAGDNPVSRFFDRAIKSADRLKSDDLRTQQIQRDGEIAIAERNAGEVGGARAAFGSMFRHPGAGLDVVARGVGSMVPTIAMGAAGVGARGMSGVNALSNAGDAASQTADELRRLPPQVWAKDDGYLDLLAQGATHEEAVAERAPIKAMAAQAVGGLTGALSGATGLEKTLAGKSVGNSLRQRAGRAGGELLGEQAETLLPQMAGNATISGLDGETNLTKGLGRAAVETAAGTIPGAALSARSVAEPAQPSATDLAKSKGFLVREARIKTLKDAGETAAAELLQQKHDKATAADSVDAELSAMPGNEAFAQHYRGLRTSGVKPAEAAARSAVTVTFQGMAQETGVPDKALQAAMTAAQDMPLDKVPGFFQRFTEGLAKRGLIQPTETMAAIGTSLEAARDDAMEAAIGAAYQPVKPVMDEAMALEGEANQAPEPTDIAQAATETIATPEPTMAAKLDVAAHDAATSPLNDLPEPTQAQKEAGNYKVGRVNLHGLNISIENPEGSTRKGTSPDGTKWENTLAAHYGYIRGTEGNDGDHVDTFIGPNPESQKVFVVDQVNKDGSFDEHKVMLGADNLQQADNLYHDNYHEGWTGRGAITEVPMAEFKAWVRDGVKTQPLGALPAPRSGKDVPAATNTTEAPALTESAQAAINSVAGDGLEQGTGTESAKSVQAVHLGRDNVPLSEGGKAFKTRKAADDARKLNPMMRVVRAEGGYALTEKTPAQLAAQEAAAKRLRNPQTSARGEPIPAHAMIAAAGGLAPDTRADMGMQGNVQIGNRKLFAGEGNGLTIERATERLVEDGYLPQGASHDQARELIKRSLTNPQYTAEGTERMAATELDARRLHHEEAQAAAVAEIEDASDNQIQEIDDADIPWDVVGSNTSSEAAMRALGFTEEEIQDAIANESGIQNQDSEDGSGLDEGSAPKAQANMGGRESQTGEDTRGRIDPRRQEAPVAKPTKTPAPAGVSASGFETVRRPDGTLTVKGDKTAIMQKLAEGGITKTTPMDGGIMVGKTQAEKALALLDNRKTQATPSVLSIGVMPNSAEPITVKDGIVHVGKYAALNFDTGEPVTVLAGATDAQIVTALKDAGAIARKQRVFGLENKITSPDAESIQQKPEALVELRKRESVLKAMRKCLGA